MPNHFSHESADLIRRLLCVDPIKRMRIAEIKLHK